MEGEVELKRKLARYLSVRSNAVEIGAVVEEDETKLVRFSVKGFGYMAVLKFGETSQIYRREV